MVSRPVLLQRCIKHIGCRSRHPRVVLITGATLGWRARASSSSIAGFRPENTVNRSARSRRRLLLLLLQPTEAVDLLHFTAVTSGFHRRLSDARRSLRRDAEKGEMWINTSNWGRRRRSLYLPFSLEIFSVLIPNAAAAQMSASALCVMLIPAATTAT